jgi:hypothetical protein
MQARLIFPLLMFALAGVSFAYGTWQFLTARAVQASANERIAHVLQTVQDQTTLSERQKQTIYVSLFEDYPPGPTFLGIDVSGIFAAEDPEDQCSNNGQRAVCRTLYAANADVRTIQAVCGACSP